MICCGRLTVQGCLTVSYGLNKVGIRLWRYCDNLEH